MIIIRELGRGPAETLLGEADFEALLDLGRRSAYTAAQVTNVYLAARTWDPSLSATRALRAVKSVALSAGAAPLSTADLSRAVARELYQGSAGRATPSTRTST